MKFHLIELSLILFLASCRAVPLREDSEIARILDYIQARSVVEQQLPQEEAKVDIEEATKVLNALNLLNLLQQNNNNAKPQKKNVEVINKPVTRQHWSHGFMPGGRRSDPSVQQDGELTASDISAMVRYLLENLERFESESYLDESSPNRESGGLESRQHWSNSWQPGGKRSAPSSIQQEESEAAAEKRQHWSFGYGPGGKKRSVDAQATDADESDASESSL